MAESLRSQLRRGKEATEATLSSSGTGSFTPVHVFESGETKYLQFLEPYDVIPEVLMHQFIIVGQWDNGKDKYERFISRKDPNIDGSDGYDELMDRFGQKPTQRNITVAVELEPQIEKEGSRKIVKGFEVAYRQYEDSEGKTVEVPNVALVIESPYTLFGDLMAVDEQLPDGIEGSVLAITVKGKGKDKSFTPIPTGIAAIDLPDEVYEFADTLDAYIEELADEDRMRELISPLPDDWKISNYDKRKMSKSKEEKATGSTRSRRTAEPEEEATEEPPTRTRRFSDMKKRAEEKAAAEAAE